MKQNLSIELHHAFFTKKYILYLFLFLEKSDFVYVSGTKRVEDLNLNTSCIYRVNHYSSDNDKGIGHYINPWRNMFVSTPSIAFLTGEGRYFSLIWHEIRGRYGPGGRKELTRE